MDDVEDIIEEEEIFEYNMRMMIHPTLSPLKFNFNFSDLYLGISTGIEDIGFQWGARLNFEFRPFYKKVSVSESQFVTRQYREKKYFLSLDLDKRFGHYNVWGEHLQFFVGAKTGFLMGNYKGTRNDAENHLVIGPMAGACINVEERVLVKLGYLYFDDRLINVPNHRVIYALQIII